MTIDQKTLTVIPQTLDAVKALAKLNGFTLADKQVAVTVNDDKAMKDLQAVAKVTIPTKEVSVNVEQPKPADVKVKMPDVKPVEVKVNEVTGEKYQAPTLQPIEQKVEFDVDDSNLEDVNDEDRKVTFTADDSGVKQAIDDIEKKDIPAKKVKLEVTTDSQDAFKKISDELAAKGLTGQVKLEPKVEPKVDLKGLNEQAINAKIAEIKKNLSGLTIGSKEWIDLKGLEADALAFSNMLQTAIKNGMDVTSLNPEEFWKNVFGDHEQAKAVLQDMLDKINAYAQEKGIDPIKVNVQTGEVTSNGKEKNNPYLHKGEDGKSMVKFNEVMGGIASGLSGLQSGFQQLGIDLGEGFGKVVGVLSGISSILTAIQTIVAVIQAISSVDAIIPFSHGGIVRAANGFVPGNYGYDAVPALLTSGEMVLNRAQQGNLASQLAENGYGHNIQLEAVIGAEQIMLIQNNRGRRTGKGEIVQSKRRR